MRKANRRDRDCQSVGKAEFRHPIDRELIADSPARAAALAGQAASAFAFGTLFCSAAMSLGAKSRLVSTLTSTAQHVQLPLLAPSTGAPNRGSLYYREVINSLQRFAKQGEFLDIELT